MQHANVRVKKIVAMLFIGWCIIWIYRTMIGVVHNEIMEVVGPQSATSLGLISSSYFAGYVAMQIPGGFLMDRFGKRNILVPSFLLLAIGFAAIGFSRSMSALYAGSAIVGVGSGTYYSGAFSLSTQNVPSENRCFATAVINSGCAFGMLVGYVGVSWLVKQFDVDWKIVPFVLVAASLAMIPALLMLLSGETEQGRGEKSAPKADVRALLHTLFAPRMIAHYFFYFSTCYGYYMIVTWLPSFLQNERGFPGALAGYASAVIAVVAIPGALFLGRVTDRFVRRKNLFLSVIQALSALALVAVSLMTNKALIVACLAFYGVFGKQAVDPLIVPCVTEQLRDSTLSTGLGVFNFFGMSASVIAPFLTGALRDSLGSQVAGFYIAVGLLGVSALILRLFRGGKKEGSL